MSVVEFQSVSKRYGHAAAVDDVSFTIEAATLVTLLGPSGCGKTTTLRLIAGLEHASSGHILIGGREVTALSAAERDVSMVFQSYALFPHMTVMENVCHGLLSSGFDRRRAEPVAAEKLRLLGLSGFERRLPSELSGGQQQRVAVARATVLEPKVLLFDEPLSNLDARLRRRVRDEIRALQQELALTVVYVTHDQQEALAVSDRVIVMNQGRIAQDGEPRALYQRPANRFIADFIGEANIVEVTARRMESGRTEVTLGKLRMVLAVEDAAAGDARPDGAALLAIRPHAVRLSATASTGGLAGLVTKAAYLGSHMEYEVEIEGEATRLFVIAGDVDAPLAAGTRVRASLDPAGVALLPEA